MPSPRQCVWRGSGIQGLRSRAPRDLQKDCRKKDEEQGRQEGKQRRSWCPGGQVRKAFQEESDSNCQLLLRTSTKRTMSGPLDSATWGLTRLPSVVSEERWVRWCDWGMLKDNERKKWRHEV